MHIPISMDFISCSQSYAASKKGNVGRGKFLGNISLTLIVITLVYELLAFLIGMLLFTIFVARLAYCGLTTPADRVEICSRVQ